MLAPVLWVTASLTLAFLDPHVLPLVKQGAVLNPLILTLKDLSFFQRFLGRLKAVVMTVNSLLWDNVRRRYTIPPYLLGEGELAVFLRLETVRQLGHLRPFIHSLAQGHR